MYVYTDTDTGLIDTEMELMYVCTGADPGIRRGGFTTPISLKPLASGRGFKRTQRTTPESAPDVVVICLELLTEQNSIWLVNSEYWLDGSVSRNNGGSGGGGGGGGGDNLAAAVLAQHPRGSVGVWRFLPRTCMGTK